MTTAREMQERCARWHDTQAAEYTESIRRAHHPADAQRMQDHLNMHERSAAAIRALPCPAVSPLPDPAECEEMAKRLDDARMTFAQMDMYPKHEAALGNAAALLHRLAPSPADGWRPK